MKVGLHVSIAGGIPQAPARAQLEGAECFQIFTRSPRGGAAPSVNRKVISGLSRGLRAAGIENFYTHTPYYINLASDNESIYQNSIRLIREDLKRSSKLGALALMTHLGSAKDLGAENSRKKVVQALVKILDNYRGSTLFLIENSAGSGKVIGSALEEIKWLIAEVEKRSKKGVIGLCYDTCHGFASGYDIRNKKGVGRLLIQIDGLIGLKRLKLIHANDSKAELGSRVDRHEHIGEGKIGQETFFQLLKNKKINHADMILETPPTSRKDRMTDLQVLKNLRDKK